MNSAAILITIAIAAAAILWILRSRITSQPINAFGERNNALKEAPKSQWSGESGYCNCLLVTMARMRIPKLSLSTERELPDLVTLAAAREDTAAWLRSQAFDLAGLDKITIIRTLAETAGIVPDRNSTGTIRAHDVEGDSGPIVVREFQVLLGHDGDGVAIRITQTLK